MSCRPWQPTKRRRLVEGVGGWLQFFGEVNIAARDETLTVTLRDIDDHALFEQTLQPVR